MELKKKIRIFYGICVINIIRYKKKKIVNIAITYYLLNLDFVFIE